MDTFQNMSRAQSVLATEDIDLLLVAPSADLRYLLGYASHATERPVLLAIARSGHPLIIMPRLEASRLPGLQEVRVVAYEETEDPFSRLAAELPGHAAMKSVLVSDQTWASVLLRLQRTFPAASFQPASTFLRRLRMIKDEHELERLREAGRRVDAAFQELLALPFAGKSEAELAQNLDSLLLHTGLARADWGPNVASGPNSSSPHHVTGERMIRDGDVVVLDFGGAVSGYQADITRTVSVGQPPTEFFEVYDAVRRAQQAGVEAVAPGVAAESVDRAARRIVSDAGFGAFFIHRTGHGVGLEVHEEPFIIEGNALRLEIGMVFSVEPGIYLPGKFGVRIEDLVAVTKDGCERLNHAPREPIRVR